MKTNVQNLIQNALGDGARSSKFDVMVILKDNGYDGRKIAVLAKSTNFPSRQHQTIDFKYKGRSVPIRGQSKYSQTWECSFYLTEDHLLKNLFEIWIESLDEKQNYVSSEYAKQQRERNATGYTSEIKIYQQNFNDTQATAEYTLHNVFPVEISPVQISAENPGSVLEFSVTFSYSHYTLSILDSTSGTLVDKFISTLKSGVSTVIADALDGITGIVDKGLETLDASLSDLIAKGEQEFEDLLNGFAEFYDPGGWFDAIMAGIGEIGESITSGISNVASSITSSFSSSDTKTKLKSSREMFNGNNNKRS